MPGLQDELRYLLNKWGPIGVSTATTCITSGQSNSREILNHVGLQANGTPSVRLGGGFPYCGFMNYVWAAVLTLVVLVGGIIAVHRWASTKKTKITLDIIITLVTGLVALASQTFIGKHSPG